MSQHKNKVLVLGFDCAEPKLVFSLLKDCLPNFQKLMQTGNWGKLTSTDPPITAPAWTAMFSGCSPEQTGVYGFQNRVKRSYTKIHVPTSGDVNVPRIWDYIPEDSIVIGVPLTFPIEYKSGLRQVAGFPFSSQDKEKFDFVQPKRLEGLLPKSFDIDIRDFRNKNKSEVLEEILGLTDQHMDLVLELIQEDWRLFCFVEILLDRIHHLFWSDFDKTSPFYKEDNQFKSVIPEYYKKLDNFLGKVLNKVNNNTFIFVVSDHGAQPFMGNILINELLIRDGFMFLFQDPGKVVDWREGPVDWSRTRAWASGGYCGRVYVNLIGREENGIVHPNKRLDVLAEIEKTLKEQKGRNNEQLNTKCLRTWKQQKCKGIPPDLLVYFDSLSYRCSGTIGNGHRDPKEFIGNPWVISTNDTGPDGANHTKNGLIITRGIEPLGKLDAPVSIYSIAPTIMEILGIEAT